MLTFLCLFSITLVLNAQKSARLKLNLEQNKVYSFEQVSKNHIKQTINGMQQNTDVTSKSVVSMKMVEKTPEFVVLEVKIDSMNIETHAGGMVIKMNSANAGNLKSSDPGEIMSHFIHRMCQNPLFAQMDYNGKIIKFINHDAYTAYVYKNLDSISGGQMAMMMKNQASNIASESPLQQMIESSTAALPGKEVKVGDSWQITNDINSNGMTYHTETDFKLKEINGNLASMTAEAVIEPASSEPVVVNGQQLTNNIRGVSKADLVVDTDTGLQVASNGKVHMEGDISINMGGNSMNIPMVIEGTVSTKLLK